MAMASPHMLSAADGHLPVEQTEAEWSHVSDQMAVDAVYTWVNHADPAWQKLYAESAPQNRSSQYLHETADDIARFQNRDELLYSIKSVEKYAPWVRTIFVVTNCELPSELVDCKRVVGVSHEEVFLEPDNLPTFNSHAIEANLHRTPGVAEHFIYFNDDVFLCRPVHRSDFFTDCGKPYVFPSRHDIPEPSDVDLRPVDSAAINVRELLSAEFGYSPRKKLHHAPFPLLRSTLFEMEERYAAQLRATASHRFRDATDLPMATTFHAYYSLARGYAEFSDIKCRYIDIGDPLFLLLIHPFSPLRRGRYQTFCLNEVKNIRYFSRLRDAIVKRLLMRMYDE